jgi:hypothetical protein
MTELTDRRSGERRRIPRGGRRTTDPLPTPVRAEIDEYARDIQAALSELRTALEAGNMPRARDHAASLRAASEAIRIILITRRSLRHSGTDSP